MDVYINSYGAYLHVKDDMFEVKVTVDEKEIKKSISPRRVRGFILAKGAALSADAVRLAMMHNVDIVFTEFDGKPVARVWHSKLGSTAKIRKEQLQASMDSRGAVWIKDCIAKKLDNEAELLRDLKKHREKHWEYIDEKAQKIDEMRAKMLVLEGNCIADFADTIRGYEGTAGRHFFECLSFLLPAGWQFDGRSSRPAKDAFNAFLNYAFGILYSKVEKVLIIAGVDPYIGFLHVDDYNQLSFVFDFIEPYRIWAIEPVFRLFSGKKVNKEHTDTITNGVSLNKAGKELLVKAFNDFMDSTVRYRNRNLTRWYAMQLDAHRFANQLIAREMEADGDDDLEL